MNCLLKKQVAILWTLSLLFIGPFAKGQTPSVSKFGVHEVTFQANGNYTNPYVEMIAEVSLTGPEAHTTRTIPLFWDGRATWKFRFSPDQTGSWKWTVKSADKGLDGQSGNFKVVESDRKGSIRPMMGYPRHFERQDGSPVWFMGDTAWALFTDHAAEKHDGSTARRYLDARSSQGFNVLHSSLLSEAGWGNNGGKPWEEIASEKINPAYWQEVDERLAYANRKGMVCGLALAWGDKRKQEPFAWRLFPSVEARKRYARYIAARYSAYDVYFLVSGEWHAEIRTRPASTDDVRREFVAIGDALQSADPHGRMIGIHPMTEQGSVREFNDAGWMSFGDYQQNYRDLHERLLQSRSFKKPMVNSEYGYLLRDQNGDGVPDKDNSTSLESMRHSTWDIVMAGGYAVTGFGTTYFGGNRDPGPFDLEAAKNKPWEEQFGHIKKFFVGLEWWKLEPHDELLNASIPRGKDGKHLNQIAPPMTTYWCLANPGQQYLVYFRGLKEPWQLSLDQNRNWQAVEFNPRTGKSTVLDAAPKEGRFEYRPRTEEDWVIFLGVKSALKNR